MCCMFLSFRNLIVTYQTLTKTSQWRKLSWPHLQTKNFSRQWIKKSFMDSPSQASRPTSKKLNMRLGPDSAVWNPAVRELGPPRGTSDPDGIHVISSTVTECVLLCWIGVRIMWLVHSVFGTISKLTGGLTVQHYLIVWYWMTHPP